ncbi:transcriptional regulator [Sporolactobacillus pectinivorans]|uniref:transcriptional regulator n=1 Tax=Sporolactobacillus pectinivorans TaxID=1591408 RepID=UPI000C25CD20|nr:transcriptional regulator [Sporolactobacillus pectinivorans]
MPVSEKLRSATFKHIEAELYAFNDTKKEIRKLREEVIFGVNNDDENVGGGRSNYPGRPTELIATRLATNRKLRNLEEIVQAIETAYSQVTEDHRKIIKLRYWSNLNLTWDSIADRCNMHRNTATKYRKDFVLIVADKIGWL